MNLHLPESNKLSSNHWKPQAFPSQCCKWLDWYYPRKLEREIQKKAFIHFQVFHITHYKMYFICWDKEHNLKWFTLVALLGILFIVYSDKNLPNYNGIIFRKMLVTQNWDYIQSPLIFLCHWVWVFLTQSHLIIKAVKKSYLADANWVVLQEAFKWRGIFWFGFAECIWISERVSTSWCP